MLDRERAYFDENREELVRSFPGKFVVLKETELVGAFDTIQDALEAGTRRFGLAHFLIRRTDETEHTVSVPALALGILRAHPNLSTGGTNPDSDG